MGRINSTITGHDSQVVFESGRPVPCADADRGERAEVDAILAEAGYTGYIEERIADGVRTRAVEMIRAALLGIIHPPKGTSAALQAVVMGYALGVPGLPSMGSAARQFGLGALGKAAISKRVKAYQQQHDLPPSAYMKSARACTTYKKTNQTKRKQ